MYKAAVRWMIRRNVAALTAGDPGPLLAGYADDAVLVFPGQSSWGGEHRGKPAIEAFLRRFLDNRLVGQAHDIVVNGPPWRTTVCVLFTVGATDPDGAVVYDNRAVLFARARWGKIYYHEDFEDTHKIEAFDRYVGAPKPGGI
jgi:ketosteroid isomerase-like protein